MKLFELFRIKKNKDSNDLVKIKLEGFAIEGVMIDSLDTAEIFLEAGARVVAIGTLRSNVFRRIFVKTTLIQKILRNGDEIVLKTQDKSYLVQK